MKVALVNPTASEIRRSRKSVLDKIDINRSN